jgi:preprotein translocase subunit YajC
MNNDKEVIVYSILASFIAQAAPAPATGQSAGSITGFLMPMVLIFVVMYFLMFRPQAKKQKEHRAMMDSLQKGDKVLTAGGIYGTIAGVKEKEDIVVLKVADNVKIDVSRGSIARKLGIESESK